jgi:hypothetical protein
VSARSKKAKSQKTAQGLAQLAFYTVPPSEDFSRFHEDTYHETSLGDESEAGEALLNEEELALLKEMVREYKAQKKEYSVLPSQCRDKEAGHGAGQGRPRQHRGRDPEWAARSPVVEISGLSARRGA